ncbi:hypothetical protein L7F22_042147 [Adiantum nelumboides]|nr:hypothetical protein [Adiantum nelumboides]
MEERRRSGWRGWWIFGGGSEPSPKSAPINMDGGSVLHQPPKKGSPAPSLRGTKSSPRSSRARPKLNMSTGNAVGGSGSENSSPATSRASSPTNSPVNLVSGKSNRVNVTRGRRISTASQESEVNAVQGERRGRDRTPSITAVSDQRLRRGSSGSTSSGRGGTSQKLEEPIRLEESKRRSETTTPIIEESTNIIDVADAAEADAQLGLLPDPQLVAQSADDRRDVEATLREPEV